MNTNHDAVMLSYSTSYITKYYLVLQKHSYHSAFVDWQLFYVCPGIDFKDYYCDVVVMYTVFRLLDRCEH